MMLQKQNGISVMAWMCMLPCGTTWVAMQFRKARRTPTRLKATMRNSDIISLVSLVLLAVFHVVHMHCTVPFVCLSITSISVSWKNIAFLNILFTSSILFTHPFSHSRKRMNCEGWRINCEIWNMKEKITVTRLSKNLNIEDRPQSTARIFTGDGVKGWK